MGWETHRIGERTRDSYTTFQTNHKPMKVLLLIATLLLPGLALGQSSTSIYERIRRARMAAIEAEMETEMWGDEEEYDDYGGLDYGSGTQVTLPVPPETMDILDYQARTMVNMNQSIQWYNPQPMSMYEVGRMVNDLTFNMNQTRAITSQGPQYMQYYNEQVRYYEGSPNPRSIWE